MFPAMALCSDTGLFELLTGVAVWIKDPPTDVEVVVSIHVGEEARVVVKWHHIKVAFVRPACILVEECRRDVF